MPVVKFNFILEKCQFFLENQTRLILSCYLVPNLIKKIKFKKNLKKIGILRKNMPINMKWNFLF